MIVSGIICLGISINFWITLALIPLVLMGIYVRKYFLLTLNELKRLEAICEYLIISIDFKYKYLIYFMYKRSKPYIYSSQ